MPNNCCMLLCCKCGYRAGPDGGEIAYHSLPTTDPRSPKVLIFFIAVVLIFNLFFTNSQIHGYSTRTANNYRVHHPKIWNSLPAQMNSLSSFANFKKKLLQFLVK